MRNLPLRSFCLQIFCDENNCFRQEIHFRIQTRKNQNDFIKSLSEKLLLGLKITGLFFEIKIQSKIKKYFRLFGTFLRKIARYRIEEKKFFKVKAKTGGGDVLLPAPKKLIVKQDQTNN